mgnify:CR=1 FL=1|jgi:DNA-binding transcriptional LysR family regulator
MLSLYKLEIFAAVIEEGSFSAAAKRLPMTQPAVSQHIQDLEVALGTQLFNRSRRGAVLTPAGETLYQYTQRILTLVSEAEAAVTTVQNLSGGQASLMATPGISVYLLPEWISLFRQHYPNLGITLTTGVTTEVAEQVATHSVDLGFVEGELDNIALGQVVLRDIDMVVVVPQGHPWSYRESVSLAALDDEPFITRQPFSRTRIWLDRLFAQHNVRPQIVGEFDNPEAIKQAVMSGMGITILPDYAIRSEERAGLVKKLPVSDKPLQRRVTMLYDTERALSPIARALVEVLSQLFPALTHFQQV